MKNGVPVLAFVGYGRAGKDTAAEWFRDNTCLKYEGGCSWTALSFVAGKLGLDEPTAWATRHERRREWYDLCNLYRKGDPAKLIRNCLKHSDIICGIRDGFEFTAARQEGLLDLVVWIDRPGTPVDPTVCFTIDDADIIIRNSGTLQEFHHKLERLAKALGLVSALQREGQNSIAPTLCS